MMNKALTLCTAGILAVSGISSAHAQSSGQQRGQSQAQTDQSKARMEMRAGNVLSLRQIERRILPRMKGSEYLGPAYDSAARAYRLKFIKKGRVTYIDVDAKTGKVINRSS